MRVLDHKREKGHKLGNLKYGDLVMVHGSDGSMRGPLMLVNPEYPAPLANAQLDPDHPEPPPATPGPPAPLAPKYIIPQGSGSGNWGSYTLLLDPAVGRLYTAHPSTRANVLNDAAIVRNYIEGAS